MKGSWGCSWRIQVGLGTLIIEGMEWTDFGGDVAKVLRLFDLETFFTTSSRWLRPGQGRRFWSDVEDGQHEAGVAFAQGNDPRGRHVKFPQIEADLQPKRFKIKGLLLNKLLQRTHKSTPQLREKVAIFETSLKGWNSCFSFFHHPKPLVVNLWQRRLAKAVA